MYTVYKATLPNNKVYIGFTSIPLSERKRAHKSLAYSKKRRQYKFANAVKKYGWDSVKWEILLETKDKNKALEYEKHCITVKYNSIKLGYNLTSGGEFCEFTEESKRNVSKGHGGVWFRVYCKKSKKLIGTWINQNKCERDIKVSSKRIRDYLNYKRFHKDYYFIQSNTFHSFDYIDYLESLVPKRGSSTMKKVKVTFKNGKCKVFKSVKYLEKALSIPRSKLKQNIDKLNIKVTYVNN